MLIFIMGDGLEQDVQRVREYSEQSAHWYKPVVGRVPGHMPEHQIISGNVRAVFTWTHHEGRVMRHLTVSKGAANVYPEPVVVFTLAHMFGFTGATMDRFGLVHLPPENRWQMRRDDEEGCIAVMEEIPG